MLETAPDYNHGNSKSELNCFAVLWLIVATQDLKENTQTPMRTCYKNGHQMKSSQRDLGDWNWKATFSTDNVFILGKRIHAINSRNSTLPLQKQWRSVFQYTVLSHLFAPLLVIANTISCQYNRVQLSRETIWSIENNTETRSNQYVHNFCM